MNPRDAAHEVLAEVSRAVVGKPEALRFVLLALLADGHVLIEVSRYICAVGSLACPFHAPVSKAHQLEGTAGF